MSSEATADHHDVVDGGEKVGADGVVVVVVDVDDGDDKDGMLWALVVWADASDNDVSGNKTRSSPKVT